MYPPPPLGYTTLIILAPSKRMEGSTYTHSTAPKPVRSKVKRTTYRDENEENIVSNNIMFDRRVVRGNTYAAQVVTQNAHREVERLRTENERTLKHETRCRRKGELGSPAAPPAVKSRANIEAQTDTFLEELSDRPIEMQIATQTESFMDRPPSPLFIPSKTGVDKETEIPPGDLFNFDLEVKPVLEVLVGKTLRSSMLEVVEEEELIAIQRRQREFEQMRNAEFIEVQRLDAEASRRFAEKQRRVAQEKEISSALDNIQNTAIQEARNEHAQYVPQWIEADAARLLAAQEARRPKSNEIFFHIDIDGTSVKVGPVQVIETDEVSAVEERVYDWLRANCDNIDIKEVIFINWKWTLVTCNN